MGTKRVMRRREFLRAALAGAACVASGGGMAPAAASPSRKDRPNVLLILSDEHNASVTGCYGNRIVRTPHLDGLAARGVTFDSAYTNSPLCVPSRLALTAGKYVSRTGAWNNDCWLPGDDYPSLPRIMTAAGYEAVLCGKMHYDRSHRYGFTEIGGNMNNSFMTGRGGRRPADNLASAGLSARFAEFRVAERAAHEAHDTRVTAGVAEFLAGRKTTDKPFFLLAGYLAPHFPLVVPRAYYEPYRGKVPMPHIPPGHLDKLPLNYKHLRAGFQLVDVPEETVRFGRELYYGLTQWIDREIGKLLAALAESRVADNTVVIYTADHGENMGEHGLWWKNCMYEHAARVPLVVRWPARWAGGQRRTGACSLVDVVQTIAELGGARVPEDWNGRSLCGYLDDAQSTSRDLAVSEYYAHNIASGFAMIRRGRHKYVYHTPPDDRHPAQRELYDLAADPGELANLAERPEHRPTLQRLHAELVKELGQHPDEIEQRCRADYAKGYGRSEEGGKGKGKGKGKAGKGKGRKQATAWHGHLARA